MKNGRRLNIHCGTMVDFQHPILHFGRILIDWSDEITLKTATLLILATDVGRGSTLRPAAPGGCRCAGKRIPQMSGWNGLPIIPVFVKGGSCQRNIDTRTGGLAERIVQISDPDRH